MPPLITHEEALQLGRLTWNPLKHIDPVMTILVPVVLLMAGGPVLGGAKPVPVNPRNYAMRMVPFNFHIAAVVRAAGRSSRPGSVAVGGTRR